MMHPLHKYQLHLSSVLQDIRFRRTCLEIPSFKTVAGISSNDAFQVQSSKSNTFPPFYDPHSPLPAPTPRQPHI